MLKKIREPEAAAEAPAEQQPRERRRRRRQQLATAPATPQPVGPTAVSTGRARSPDRARQVAGLQAQRQLGKAFRAMQQVRGGRAAVRTFSVATVAPSCSIRAAAVFTDSTSSCATLCIVRPCSPQLRKEPARMRQSLAGGGGSNKPPWMRGPTDHEL